MSHATASGTSPTPIPTRCRTSMPLPMLSVAEVTMTVP